MSGGPSCPKCGGEECHAVGSAKRGTKATKHAIPAYRRRRECKACGHRFATVEVTAEYLDALEEWRKGGLLTDLQKAKSALGTSIDILTKVKGGPLL